MSSKHCSSCKQLKPLTDFHNDNDRRDGKTNWCKLCNKKRYLKYCRTKKGLINQIYNNQIGTSKKRNHYPPDYTQEMLKEWIISQSNFDQLYKDWVASDYDTSLRPSPDQLDDSEPYTFDNLQLMTWGENKQKGYDTRRKQRVATVDANNETKAKCKPFEPVTFDNFIDCFKHASDFIKCNKTIVYIFKINELFLATNTRNNGKPILTLTSYN